MIRTQMEIAQEWFQFVDQYWWCPNGIMDEPGLSPSVETVLEMLEESWDLGDPDRAWIEIERITQKRLQMSSIESSVATKLCGQILLAMQNREGTERLLRKSLISMPRSEKHFVAVLTWMLGIIHWLRPGRHTEAINEWKESISLFYENSRDPATGMRKKNWYTAQLRIMRDALRKAIREDQLPPLGGVQGVLVPIPIPRAFGGRAPRDGDDDDDEFGFDSQPDSPDESGDQSKPPPQPDSSPEPESPAEPPSQTKQEEQQEDISRPETPPDPEAEPEKSPKESPKDEQIQKIRKLPLPELPADEEDGMIPIDEDILPPDTSPISPFVQEFLELVQVQDQIVTSPFEDIPEEPNDMPYVEISIVRIGYKDYNIHYLGKKGANGIINIYGKENYFLKIKGKSMNAAGIEDGDYVLIRYQNTAENGDIVAAIIRDEKDPLKAKASLKKFLTGRKMGTEKSKKNMITLKAVSYEDEFKDLEWTFSPEQENQEDGFLICGIVIAVLKPIKRKIP